MSKLVCAITISKQDNGDLRMESDHAEDADEWSIALMTSAMKHIQGLMTKIDQENAKAAPGQIH